MLRIMIVEDNIHILCLLKEVFQKDNNFQLICCSTNKTESIQLVKEHLNVLDLILMDINLDTNDGENVDGVVAVREIREFADMDRLKIIMLSCYDDRGHVIDATEAGANGYIKKSSGLVNMPIIVLHAYNNLPIDEHKQELIFENELFKDLSPREKEIVEMKLEGLSQKDIIVKSGVTENTVKTLLSRAYSKLNIKNIKALKFLLKKRSL